MDEKELQRIRLKPYKDRTSAETLFDLEARVETLENALLEVLREVDIMKFNTRSIKQEM